MMKIALLTLLASGCHASLYSSKSIRPVAAFIPRGGSLGPIEQDLAVKVYGGIQFVQGLVQTLSPSTHCDIYGIADAADGSSCNRKLLRQQGIATLQQGIMAYLLFSKELSNEEAGGIASLAVVAERLSSLLNEDSKTTGPAKWVDTLTLASAGAAAVAGIGGLGWATLALKVTGACHVLLCGLPLMAGADHMVDNVLECKGTNAVTASVARGLGWAMASTGALLAGLAWGASTATSFGASMVVTAVSAAKYLLTDEKDDKLGTNKAAVVAWAIVPAVLAAAVFMDE